MQISHEEFITILNEKEKYEKMKKKHQKHKRKISKCKLNSVDSRS